MSAAYQRLIRSERVGAATRQALETRQRGDDRACRPGAMSSDAFATLRAVLDHVIPQDGPNRIDLAACIDTQLHSGGGDGWRFAALPADAAAYRAGLHTLSQAALERHGNAFIYLQAALQDCLLKQVAAGTLDAMTPTEASQRLDAGQMRCWFEDLRADAVRCYVAHPQTLARIGYSGIANGGDGTAKSGFITVGIDEREPWEPLADPQAAS